MLGSDFPREEAAAARLEQLTSERISTGYIAYPISRYAEDAARPGDSLHQIKKRAKKKLCSPYKGSSSTANCHPLFDHSEASPRHIKQRVLLTGFNTETFATALIGLERVDSHLRLNIREDIPQPLRTSPTGFQQVVEIANRYFTSKRMADPEDQIRIPAYVDPKGILDSIKGENLSYTSENQVEYYERITSDGSNHRFITTSPARLNEGDIVEVQFTIALVESNTTNHSNAKLTFTTKPVLRSITLLDNTFSEIYRSLLANQPRKPSLKRKVGHAEEDAMETQQKLKRMVIDTEK
ncbi:hypothetical protein VNI00_015248 [Paramarasmius palmivorus]|uniref:Uncharacterized protein n=1 Tax=Paramarasmius palmivorus TaxID=297713 RepID=A0AAW0BKC0_9AGAR